MSGRARSAGTEDAVYAIHIAGPVGPILVSSLVDAGEADGARWDVRSGDGSLVLVSVTDDDFVEVVRRLADDGVEIGSVRDLGASDHAPEVRGQDAAQTGAPACGGPTCSRMRYSQNS